METWSRNHVLGLCLCVLLLGLPGPLGAGTPGNGSADPVTAGLYYTTGRDEVGNTERGATSTSSSSSESLSPSQRNLLLTHAAASGTGRSSSIDEDLPHCSCVDHAS